MFAILGTLLARTHKNQRNLSSILLSSGRPLGGVCIEKERERERARNGSQSNAIRRLRLCRASDDDVETSIQTNRQTRATIMSANFWPQNIFIACYLRLQFICFGLNSLPPSMLDFSRSKTIDGWPEASFKERKLSEEDSN